MNALQERALNLLRDITPQFTRTVLRRSEGVLLVTDEEQPPNTRDPNDLGKGWAFVIGSYFLNALDVKLTSKVVQKVGETVWTQGSAFAIARGYTFHSVNAEQPYCINIYSAQPANPASFDLQAWPEAPDDLAERIMQATDADFHIWHGINPHAKKERRYELRFMTQRNPGFIVSKLYLPAEPPAVWKYSGSMTTNQDDFVYALIMGHLPDGTSMIEGHTSLANDYQDK